MRRLILVFAVMGVALLLASGAALAITCGTVDGNRHPNVGALLWPEGFDDGTYTYCTGTLISPTVFLTAAHCDAWTDDGVTFDDNYDPETSELYLICAGRRCADNPKYDAQWHAHRSIDIAVVEFDEPISGITPARLPSLHRLNDVAKDQRFTAVGYGAVKEDNQSGGPSSILYDDQRRYAASTFKSVNRDHLRLSQNLNQDNGGTCYGDSGGPNFFGAGNAETNVIASTTITGDTWCKATNVTLRLDTVEVQNFLEGFGVPPRPKQPQVP